MRLKSEASRCSKLARELPLRLILIVPFVVQIVGAVGLVGYLSLKNGAQAVNDLAAQLMNKVSELVDQHLDAYLAVPHQINQTNTDAIKLGLLHAKDFQSIGHFFWKEMQIFDASFINYGLVTGKYVGSGHYDNTVAITESFNSKAYAYSTDSQGNRTKVKGVFNNYDPRTEAWYKNALHAGRPVWSQVYTWDTAPEYYISIAASRPIYDTTHHIIGALGVDLLLSSASSSVKCIT